MIRNKQTQQVPIVVDLTGPQGNAYFLLGMARDLGKRLGFEKEVVNTIDRQMREYSSV
jgi:hypothetical protein